MLNFPLPYPDELLYSTIARAGVHFAITSPKQLLDEVFGNRKVIATIDFPNHLCKLGELLPQPKYDLETLAYQHTLFPLYAQFIPEERRQRCLHWMSEQSQGSIHLALGVVASRIGQLEAFRYCPQCFQEQLRQHGELYWSRIWQVKGADTCLKHGSLLNALLEKRDYHRHQYVTPEFKLCPPLAQQSADQPTQVATSRIDELLKMPSSMSASFAQWTAFYQHLAAQTHCLRGEQHIDHEAIQSKICAKWPRSWLVQNNLYDLGSDTSWLKTIFRKHRKSFSYLEHIVVLEALQETSWDFPTILESVHAYKGFIQNSAGKQPIKPADPDTLFVNRECWLNSMNTYGIKPSRLKLGDLYAWLYRNDKDWLLQQNRPLHHKHIPDGPIVDWGLRDRLYLRQLSQLMDRIDNDLAVPRYSKNWLISQLHRPKTVEKNLDKLPITRQFLDRYSEDIASYQIRRMTRAIIYCREESLALRRWIILRQSGLSDERITSEAQRFLDNVLRIERE